jgi:4-hydroxy-tetrahydrodipicolinate synthase
MTSNFQSERFKGVFTALATPLSEDAHELDLTSYKNLIKFQLESGVNGLVVAGSTGEAATLSDSELEKLGSCAIEQVEGKIPIVLGINANNTSRAVELAKIAQQIGADGILLVVPFYNKPSQEGMIAHFSAVRESVDIPIIGYNVPSRTGVNMLPVTVAKLAETGTISALKDASGSMEQMLETLRLCRNQISIFSGEDSLAFCNLAAGGAGVISATANVAPQLFSNLYSEFCAGSLEKSREVQFRLLPLISAMFIESNPVPVKEALRQKGVIKSGSVRLPLLKASQESCNKIRSVIQSEL